MKKKKTLKQILGQENTAGYIFSLPFIIGGLAIAWLASKEKLPQGPFPKGEKVKLNEKKK